MTQGPGPGHAGQPADARPAQDAVQNRLGLVVGRVGGGHEASPQPAGGFFEEAVARRAGGGFQSIAGVGRQLVDGGPPHFAPDPQVPAQLHDEALVLVGGGAQLVVEMGGAEAARPAAL